MLYPITLYILHHYVLTICTYIMYLLTLCTYYTVSSTVDSRNFSQGGTSCSSWENVLQMESNLKRSLSSLLRLFQTSRPGHILTPLPGTLVLTLFPFALLFISNLHFPASLGSLGQWSLALPLGSLSPMYLSFTALPTWNTCLSFSFTGLWTL